MMTMTQGPVRSREDRERIAGLTPQKTESPQDLVDKGTKFMNRYCTKAFQEAVSCFREAIMAAPGFSPAYAALAETYSYWGFRQEITGLSGNGYYTLAYKNAEIALKLAPERGDAHRAMSVALRRGPQADEARRREEAEVAVELSPKDGASWHERWRAFGYDLDDQSIQRAIELAPRLSGAYIDYGVALCEQGRFGESIRQLRKAVELNPSSTLAYYNMAMVLDRQNRRSEARDLLTRVKARHATCPLIENGLETLN